MLAASDCLCLPQRSEKLKAAEERSTAAQTEAFVFTSANSKNVCELHILDHSESQARQQLKQLKKSEEECCLVRSVDSIP